MVQELRAFFSLLFLNKLLPHGFIMMVSKPKEPMPQWNVNYIFLEKKGFKECSTLRAAVVSLDNSFMV